MFASVLAFQTLEPTKLSGFCMDLQYNLYSYMYNITMYNLCIHVQLHSMLYASLYGRSDILNMLIEPC